MILAILSNSWLKSLVKHHDSDDKNNEGRHGEPIEVAENLEAVSGPGGYASKSVADEFVESLLEAEVSASEDVNKHLDEEHDLSEEPEEVTEIIPEVSPESGSFEAHDPLAPAYDLEAGEPVRPRVRDEGPGLPGKTKVRSAKEFFSQEILYRFDILEPEERAPLLGKYRLELKGYRGGVWTVFLAEDIQVVNRREDADVVLTMQQRDFVSLVNGDLNPQLGILAQKIRIQGDIRKAAAFNEILTPSSD